MRREFPKPVKRAALKRAAGKCEAEDCGVPFGVKFHFDHVIADGLGGEPTLENCAVLCHVCHHEKTRKHDVPRIAKMKRVRDRHDGITAPRSKIASRGFPKAPPQRRASSPVNKWRGF